MHKRLAIIEKTVLLPVVFLITFSCAVAQEQAASDTATGSLLTTGNEEAWRPQIHFTPKAHWMNDPNGMIFVHGTWHLFYQYHPYSSVWGPMHWGHATSTDLVHWERLPIAIYPDSAGFIFSGSAVVDSANTSGFGTNGKPPLVAIFTQEKPLPPDSQRHVQHQSIAYSLDNGNSWTTYPHNPVIPNPGIADFRDPKVMWHQPTQKWIMTLAVGDHVSFYTSANLKNWEKQSDFGTDLGAHGGVWECPDLVPMEVGGKQVWLLIVSINPGGPNGGSATQYFTGDFDGHHFTPYDTLTRWLDYGPDDYAGVTWSNTGSRTIFLGWMSNWDYGKVVPTYTWRSAMTIPRDLNLEPNGKTWIVTSTPVSELAALDSVRIHIPKTRLRPGKPELVSRLSGMLAPSRLQLTIPGGKDIMLLFTNTSGDTLRVGYESATKQFFIDRTKAGLSDFYKGFARKLIAPQLGTGGDATMDLWMDHGSLELFADGGRTVMTALFFPRAPFDKLSLESSESMRLGGWDYTLLRSIW